MTFALERQLCLMCYTISLAGTGTCHLRGSGEGGEGFWEGGESIVVGSGDLRDHIAAWCILGSPCWISVGGNELFLLDLVVQRTGTAVAAVQAFTTRV